MLSRECLPSNSISSIKLMPTLALCLWNQWTLFPSSLCKLLLLPIEASFYRLLFSYTCVLAELCISGYNPHFSFLNTFNIFSFFLCDFCCCCWHCTLFNLLYVALRTLTALTPQNLSPISSSHGVFQASPQFLVPDPGNFLKAIN